MKECIFLVFILRFILDFGSMTFSVGNLKFALIATGD